MLDYIKIFFTFFKIGIVNFGGGYAMLPLLDRELSQKRGWTTADDLADYYAVGQCTPGAIAVNVSTFIGCKKKGILGGIVATLGFVSPAFFIIYLIATLLTNFSDNQYVIYALAGIRVAVVALVLSAVVKLAKKSIKDIVGLILAMLVAVLAIFVKAIPLYVYVIVAAIFGLSYKIILERQKAKKEAKEEKSEENVETTEVKEENNEAKQEVVGETKDSINKQEKKSRILNLTFGLVTGLIIGWLGFIAYPFVKNKAKYKEGLISTSLLWTIMGVATLITVFNGGNATIFSLYFEFFRIGFCAFGGGLATIPFLSELGDVTGWFTQLDLANMIAVSESTPGAMGINMSTYVGYTVTQAAYNNYFISFVGSMFSTLGLVTPSIIVIVIVYAILAKFRGNKYVEYAFYGLRAASIGLIIAAFYSILKVSVIDIDSAKIAIDNFKEVTSANWFGDICSNVASLVDGFIKWKNMALALVMCFAVFKFKKHPIVYIAVAAVMGILLCLV